MVDWRKVFNLISSRDHCQRSPPLWISDMPRAGFEPAKNLSSSLVEWSCAVVITTTSGRELLMICQKSWGTFLADLRTLLQRLLACLNFTLDSEDGSNTSSLKPQRWVRLDLIIAFTMRDIYINSNLKPLTKFNSCSRSTEPKDILLWNISQIIMKSIPISMRIVISYAMEQGILIGVRPKVNGNWA